MKEDFVSYSLSKRLKAIGFDYDCFAFYQEEYTEVTPIMVDDDNQYRLTGFRTCKNSEIPNHYTSAPTFSQAFRWFREKHKLSSYINSFLDDNEEYIYFIENYKNNPYKMINSEENFKTFEEAELACLKKLIEFIEQN